MCKLCQKDKTGEDEQLNIFNQSGEVSSSPPVAATVLLTMTEDEQQPPGTPSPLPQQPLSPLPPPPLPPLPQQPIQQQLLLQQPPHHHTNSSTSSESLSVEDEKVVEEANNNINSLLTTTTSTMDDGTGGQGENVSGDQRMPSEKITGIFPATLYSSIFDQSSASNSSINSVALATFLQVQSFQEFDSETLDTDYIGDNIVGYFNESRNHVIGDSRNFSEMYGKVFFVRGLSTTSSGDSSSTCCDIAIIWKSGDEMDTACQVERLAVKDYEYLLSQR
jgi:hypothetical protein